jgi:hypothetical protein
MSHDVNMTYLCQTVWRRRVRHLGAGRHFKIAAIVGYLKLVIYEPNLDLCCLPNVSLPDSLAPAAILK